MRLRRYAKNRRLYDRGKGRHTNAAEIAAHLAEGGIVTVENDEGGDNPTPHVLVVALLELVRTGRATLTCEDVHRLLRVAPPNTGTDAR
jgi:polyhydroxyalkanoate synthesis regulator protein